MQEPPPPGLILHYGRALLGSLLIAWSWTITFAQSVDLQVVGSSLNALVLGALGVWALYEHRKLKLREQKDKQDRASREASFAMEQEQRKQTFAIEQQQKRDRLALELREQKSRERMALRMHQEHEQAMKGTLTSKIEELTRQLEEALAERKAVEDQAVKERAELKEAAESARAAAIDAERRLSDILDRSHRSLADRLDRGSEQLKEIKSQIEGHRRILIVEDDRDACRAMAIVLRKEEFEVECAHSLAEARKKFTGRCYWVWVDLVLPDGSGLDFAREVKASGKNIKVGLMTGRDSDEVEADADLAQVDLMRTKPIGKISELIEDMRALDEEAPRSATAKPMKKRRN